MKLLILATIIAAATASCPNLCSGHGTCGNDDTCTCYQDWITGDQGNGGDCRDRRCPYELAWADTPTAANKAHALLECAGKGICDRKSGECECFDGYEGKGCRRQTCPNDCSGHGTCEYIKELRATGDAFKWMDLNPTTDAFYHTFTELWDFDRARACLCDAKWTDVDCSRRQCPTGNYALYSDHAGITGTTSERQSITFASASFATTQAHYISILYRSNLGEEYITKPLTIIDTLTTGAILGNQLKTLPNKILEGITVSIGVDGADGDGPFGTEDLSYTITFSGTHMTGNNDQIQLVRFPVLSNTVAGSSNEATAATGFNAKTDTAGYYPFTYGLLGHTGTTIASVAGSPASSVIECAGRGACDYDTGLCDCFSGYTGEACTIQTALI